MAKVDLSDYRWVPLAPVIGPVFRYLPEPYRSIYDNLAARNPLLDTIKEKSEPTQTNQ